MKNTFKKIIVSLFMIITPLFINNILAQPNPPGDSPVGSGGQAGGPAGGGAPIDGGISILLAMGALYGGSKVYNAINKKKEA